MDATQLKEQLSSNAAARFKRMYNEADPSMKALGWGAWLEQCENAIMALDQELHELMEDFLTRVEIEVEKIENDLLDGQFYLP